MVHQFSGHTFNTGLVRKCMDVIVEDRFHPRLGFRGSLAPSLDEGGFTHSQQVVS